MYRDAGCCSSMYIRYVYTDQSFRQNDYQWHTIESKYLYFKKEYHSRQDTSEIGGQIKSKRDPNNASIPIPSEIQFRQSLQPSSFDLCPMIERDQWQSVVRICNIWLEQNALVL